ncbi:MAG: general secretion pathway protein GspK [Planctomycetes bacterium]|nr:general secretion pathway protein GspK [Planctomycetota bacterium]
MTGRRPYRQRRGSVILVVMWAIAIGALILSSVQLFSYRHAMLARQALGRIQARWAARGGLEYTIAIMADHTLDPVPGDAFAMVRDMDAIADGRDGIAIDGRIVGGYDIRHHSDGKDWWGPMDEHSKININAAIDNPRLLHNLDNISPDVVDAILDWIDEDQDERPLGAERHYYLSLSMPYEPRNAPMRSIAELELVAGVWPDHLRGEDWNLNNRLDPNEDDADRTWPPDEPDQRLDAAWSGILTTYSVSGGLTDSGLARIDLQSTTPEELMERLDITEEQASSLISFGGTANSRLEQLLTRQVQQASERSARPGGVTSPSTTGPVLTDDELRGVFAETSIGDPRQRRAGKLNINTVSEEVLLQLLQDREYLADEIIYLRASRPEGIASLVDLIDIPAFQDDPATLEYIAGIMDVSSSVYSITVKGRSRTGDVEVEIFAVVDRSTVPVRILEYRE